MQYSLLLTALCASAALAIKVNKPDNTTTWGNADDIVIEWSTVDTDPTKFDIYLVNSVVNPSFRKLLANGVSTSLGKYGYLGLDAPAGQGYQINLISTDNTNSGILAQSNQFTIKDSTPSGASSPSASSTSSSASSTSSASSASSSASSTSSASSSSSASSASSSSSASSVSSAASASSASQSAATASQSDASTTGTATTSATGTAAGSTTSSSVSPKPTSAGHMNAVSMAGLGFGALFALLL